VSVRLIHADCRLALAGLAAQSVHCCVTSPPYFGLRDYGVAGQVGLEPTPGAFVEVMVEVFRAVRRVLRDDGTLWLNLGDSYAGGQRQTGRNDTNRETPGGRGGSFRGGARRAIACDTPGIKPKDLIGIPWRVAFALQADGWYLRSDIIWNKPNPMPESVTDRPTCAHEHIFLLAKSERYFYDADAIRDPLSNPDRLIFRHSVRAGIDTNGGNQANGFTTQNPKGSNKRNVWTVATQPYSGAHFATFPPRLIEPCILAGCPPGGTVLDPFAGAGTTGLVADRLGRNAVLIELNSDYAGMTKNRIVDDAGLFAEVQQEAAQ
jgi:DNA modification methylase